MILNHSMYHSIIYMLEREKVVYTYFVVFHQLSGLYCVDFFFARDNCYEGDLLDFHISIAEELVKTSIAPSLSNGYSWYNYAGII